MKWPFVSLSILTGVVQSVWAEPVDLHSILLYPNSTLQIELWGTCAILSNTASDTLIYVPTSKDGWKSFEEHPRGPYSIKGCQK